ncbi:Inositol-1-monophosphatase [bacterium HR29]|jgi:myo-inositol-1(or 4)-monophosphatase|nr:Inositol-1-monophosphatase [bacterium HR29]
MAAATRPGVTSAPELPVGRSGRDALTVALAVAEHAARMLRRRYGKPTRTRWKGRGNVVTDADLAVERMVREALAAEFPDHGFLAEETAASGAREGWLWVCDPLDGTKNFSRGIPHFAFTLGLWCDGEPLAGVTVQPATRETFTAAAGRGACWNRRPCGVSGIDRLDRAVTALDLGYDERRGAAQLELARRFWGQVETVRISGSAALGLAYVAAGKWDLFVHRNMQPWDLAAGILLVREAGGVVTDGGGRAARLDSEFIVAGTPAVHAEFFARGGLEGFR